MRLNGNVLSGGEASLGKNGRGLNKFIENITKTTQFQYIDKVQRVGVSDAWKIRYNNDIYGVIKLTKQHLQHARHRSTDWD